MCKKIVMQLLLILLIAVSNCTIAMEEKPDHMQKLDIVSYQLSDEQWATTNTAKVIVEVSATVSSANLAILNQQIMQKLAKLSKSADWHITLFQRNQDSSELERVVVQAEARLPEAALSDLRQNAKLISKPGEVYKIADIQFVPSLAEIQAVKTTLRSKIYDATKIELEKLNKIYNNQNYKIHKITFVEEAQPYMPANMMMVAKTDRMGDALASSMAVSNKIVVAAKIELASCRKMMDMAKMQQEH